MREKLAIIIVLITALLVLLLAALFARMQNPPEGQRQPVLLAPIEAPGTAEIDAERVEAGYRVYRQQTCARCHSIAGKGNSRNPLDGVGSRRSAEELRQWITGAENLKQQIPERAYGLKQAYREMATDELDVLVVYLQSL